ncbi:carbohydrate ABC transporter permease [Limnochorda pilosa]|nr:sugar ABC transporter permease [Limnochorda pilosa]
MKERTARIPVERDPFGISPVAEVGRRVRRNAMAYGLILPAVLGMLLVHYIPMLSGFVVSFKDVNLFTVAQWTEAPWVGFRNFVEGFDPATRLGARFWRSLWNVTYFGAVTILVGYVIGMAAALLLNRPFPGRSLVRGLVLLPYITPDSVAFSVWRFIFQARIGLVNKWLLALGIIEEPTIWLVGSKSLYAVMVAAIWKGWPFAALILMAGLQSIPAELHEAAHIDGASPWQRFRYVILPLLAPVSRTLILMSVLWNYNAFNQFFVMLGKDPGLAADVPSTLIQRESFTTFAFGVGSAMSLALMAVMLLFTVLYLRVLRSESAPADR